MIAVKLRGRLGNQLFQYALVYTISKKMGVSFYIDKSENDFLLPEYFTIQKKYAFLVDNLFKIRGYKNLLNYNLRRWFYKSISRLLNLQNVIVEIDANPGEILSEASNQKLYSGFFQSELFFEGVEEEIRQQFQIVPHHRDEFQKKYGSLYSKHKIACVHIRRTDYLNLGVLNLGGEDLSIPLSYYKKVISSIKDTDTHFIFIGDDHEYIAENFSGITNKTISTGSEITDFQHMLNAHYCITANSTFSWWGAWLNSNPAKHVYAPQYFLGNLIGKEWPPHIYPSGWNIIEV